MWRFLAGKLVEAALVCVAVSIITFALIHWTGDLAVSIGGMDASKEEVERLRKLYGLDRSWLVQYLEWAGSALRGDFGISFFSKEDVFRLILARLPVTVTLAFLSLGLGIAIVHSVATEAQSDPQLKVIDVTHLFGSARSNIVLRPTMRQPEHVWHFVELLAPEWNRRRIADAIEGAQEKARATAAVE